MGSTLTMLGVLGFLALAGLSFSSVSSSPVSVDKKLIGAPSNWTQTPLKVEAVYHEGRVKKFMSYLQRVPLADTNGTVHIEVLHKKFDENDPKLAKYMDFFQHIPPPFLLPSIFTAAVDPTFCPRESDIWVQIQNAELFHVWPVNKKVELWTGLLSQCDPTEMPCPSDGESSIWNGDGRIKPVVILCPFISIICIVIVLISSSVLTPFKLPLIPLPFPVILIT